MSCCGMDGGLMMQVFTPKLTCCWERNVCCKRQHRIWFRKMSTWSWDTEPFRQMAAFRFSVKLQTPLPTFIYFFPFYRDECDSWQTSEGGKVKVGLRGLDVPSISTLLSNCAQRSSGVRSWDSIMGGINQPCAHMKSFWLANILFTSSPVVELEQPQLPGRDGTESSPVAILSHCVHRAAANTRATSY